MIAITNIVWSTLDPVIIHNTSECRLSEMTARVSRHATLNCGAVIVHGGVSHGDRTLYIEAAMAQAQETALRSLFENSTGVHIALSDGLFYGAISEVKTKQGRVKATILIKSKENT